MKNKKYYTPAIEEFHIGFECELMSSYGYLKGEWPNIMMEDTHMMMRMERLGRDLTKMTKSGTFRVKYLDQKDIEDLGFELLPRYSNSTGTYESQSRWQLNYHHPEHGGNCWTEIYGNIPDSIDLRFKGIIKNKSELTRILKSIGYDKSSL